MDISEIKKNIAQAVRTLSGGEVLTLTVGHVSCRIPDSDNILMLGHCHKAFKTLDTITEEDIIEIDLDGSVIEGNYKPPGEFYIHTEIYKKRPDVNSVIHGHPEMSTAFSVAGRKIIPVFLRGGQFAPEVPVYDFAGQIDTKELGDEVAETLGSACAVLLRGHGSVVVGSSIDEAGVNAFMLEVNAKIQFYASMLGNPKPLTAEELKMHKPTSVWCYYVKKYDPMFGK